MSLSQRALILIRLDARRHEGPVSIADLASHMDLPELVIRERVMELQAEGYVEPVWQQAGPDLVGLIIAVRLVGRLPSCG